MRVIVTGGGTGGHIYPALAFVKYLKEQEPESDVLYVGGKRGLEGKIVPEAGVDFVSIELQGFKRSLSPTNFKTVAMFLKSIKKAKKIIQDFQPDVVIGTGGYVSGSVMYQASKMGIPTIVHEQNSVPGVTNKFLSRYATAVATCFEGVGKYFPKSRVELIGNPRAQEVAMLEKSNVLQEYGLDSGKKTAVIFGGSQGALKINQAFVEAMQSFEGKEYQVLYASGERYFKQFQDEFEHGKLENVSIVPYISNMPEVLASSALMVGRSGATSIAEITGLGLPSILIPSPYVTNDHQTKNAEALVKKGAAKLILDAELNGQTLVRTMDTILTNDEEIQAMRTASKGMGVPDASERLLRLTRELVSGGRG